MELRHLRYFLAVAEELHFTRAAARLHIGQPPLSQQIQALEEELGVVLFERNRRRVALTEAGKCFLAGTRRVFAEVERAVDDARRAARGEVGELRVGYSASLPFTSLLPRVLHDYRQMHPDVELTLSSLFSAEQYDALLAERLDVGLLRFSGVDVPTGIALHEISRDVLRVVIHESHPLAQQASIALIELKDEGFITYPHDLGARFNIHERQLCLAAGFDPKVVQEAREATTQIGLVAAGFGVALLPAPLECVRIDGVRYVPLQDETAYVVLAAATRRGRLPKMISDFLDVLMTRNAEMTGGRPPV
ncbi:MAG: LysR substrate-binding domain-containing protein [Formivibrio sp.]|nr:LysR substrate-binding domain-containing protein [Formivibrio sp.]